jgi:hypothetical protein
MRLGVWLVCCGVGLAQAAGLTVAVVPLEGKGQQMMGKLEASVPYVKAGEGASAQQQSVVRKINDRLFVEQFAVLAPRQIKAKFVVTEGMDIAGLSTQEVSVLRNDERVLTIALDREWCGAYCENSNHYYQFDIQTGAMLQADDLLTDAGKLQLQRWMRQKRIAAYQQQLAVLAKERRAEKSNKQKPSKEDGMDIEDRIFFNQDCINQIKATKETRAQEIERFGYHKMALLPASLNLVAYRCSNHAMRALDEVDTVTLEVPYAKLEAFFTPYAKAVLLNQGQGQAPLASSSYGQLLRGTLGKATPITMLLTKNTDGRVIGKYFYDKFGTAIELGGVDDGHRFELTETAPTEGTPREVATLRLQRQGSQLKGTWTGKADGKILDIELTR